MRGRGFPAASASQPKKGWKRRGIFPAHFRRSRAQNILTLIFAKPMKLVLTFLRISV